jgi:hypothetical protein
MAHERWYDWSNASPAHVYFSAYKRIHGEYPVAFVDDLERPHTFNCGVIVSDRDYSTAWRAGFERVWRLAQERRRGFRGLQAMFDLGQLVWNHVAWDADADELPEKYNTFSYRPRRGAVLVHYARAEKWRMATDFVRWGGATAKGRRSRVRRRL